MSKRVNFVTMTAEAFDALNAYSMSIKTLDQARKAKKAAIETAEAYIAEIERKTADLLKGGKTLDEIGRLDSMSKTPYLDAKTRAESDYKAVAGKVRNIQVTTMAELKVVYTEENVNGKKKVKRCPIAEAYVQSMGTSKASSKANYEREIAFILEGMGIANVDNGKAIEKFAEVASKYISGARKATGKTYDEGHFVQLRNQAEVADLFIRCILEYLIHTAKYATMDTETGTLQKVDYSTK